ncbi:hypothetical protein KEM55_003569, partial [Ascosphaera atra]
RPNMLRTPLSNAKPLSQTSSLPMTPIRNRCRCWFSPQSTHIHHLRIHRCHRLRLLTRPRHQRRTPFYHCWSNWLMSRLLSAGPTNSTSFFRRSIHLITTRQIKAHPMSPLMLVQAWPRILETPMAMQAWQKSPRRKVRTRMSLQNI